MKPLTHSLLALLATASIAPAATLINVDFGNGGAYTGGAVLGSTGDIWNKPTTSGSAGSMTVPASTLNWADGSGSSGISLSALSGTFNNQGNFGSTTNQMMKDYIYMFTGAGNGPVNFRLSGFTPNSTVASIVFYGSGDTAGQNASFTVGGFPTETTIAPSNDAGSPTSSTPEGDVYVRFDNVPVDGSGNVDFTWSNPAGGANFAAFNGMQIQTVPEPGALSALLGGTGVLLGLRRRRS